MQPDWQWILTVICSAFSLLLLFRPVRENEVYAKVFKRLEEL